MVQLTGNPNPDYDPQTGVYPQNLNNRGFVINFEHQKKAPPDPTVVMQGFSPARLPVLNQLAREFAVCDRWFSSLPGPTWPNRFFVHAATSGGLDQSPSLKEIAGADTFFGYHFDKGRSFTACLNSG
jgi:phospholipase C